MSGTSLCIVTMNRAATLRQTVESVFGHARGAYEVIIVDNGSTDPEAVAYLESLEGRCTVIRNESNLGLSRATNQGFEVAQYDHLIHMDDDALVTLDGWNQILSSFLDAHPEVGCAAPDRGNTGSIAHPSYSEVRWFLGMLWVLRRSIFEEVGGYDERLMHQQECDLCLRVRMHGYVAAQCPGLPVRRVVHNDGAPQSAMSKAREDLGTVQFHDKWCEYFRGSGWSYGTTPRYLMQHFPIDQDFLTRLSEPLSLNADVQELAHDGQPYWVVKELRPDRAFAEARGGQQWEEHKQQIITTWFELTGEVYEGYEWGRVPYGLPSDRGLA